MSTHENSLDAHVARALQELLAGRVPAATDIEPLKGEIKACIDALTEALHADGVQAVRKAFGALAKDRPWLSKLASQSVGGAATQEQGPTRRIRFLPDSVFENRPPREWLIPAILPKAGIALVFGPPGCGKSFLTMAWSLCIASGTSWLGHPVLQGPVAYIAGEGAFGIGPRIKAWKHHHSFTGDSGVRWFDETIMLQDTGNLTELMTAFTEDFPEPPVLVVIDTLSRCSGGADENSNTEMAKVIASADLIQQRFHCTVLIVHHAGKDKDKGPRGASSLIGNTETILEVMPTEEGCRLVCYKQKDAPKFDPLALQMERIEYGPGKDDNSVVLIYGNSEARPKMKPSESVMYAALVGKKLTHTEWKKAGVDAKLADRTAALAIKSLVESGQVQKIGKHYSIPLQEQAEPDGVEDTDEY